MQAILYSEFGAARDVLRLETVSTPDPAAGEVLVEMRMSGVNPSDVKARAGARPGVTKPPFPQIIPHSDGAGVIVAVGDGVDPARLGQRVWVWNGQWQRAFGTAASHCVLPAAQAVPLPAEVSFETGASLGIPGLTATQAVFGNGDVGGKTVLVHGGAGSVGGLAVQLAAWGGAKVIATARNDDLAKVQANGAAAVVDYRSDDLAAAILAANGGGPVDHIVEVEFGINADTDAAVIAENGSIAAYGSAKNMRPEMPFYTFMFKAVRLDTILIYLLPPAARAAAIERLHKALVSGGLTIPVDGTFALKDTAAAHEEVEAGRRDGATLVQVV